MKRNKKTKPIIDFLPLVTASFAHGLGMNALGKSYAEVWICKDKKRKKAFERWFKIQLKKKRKVKKK